MYFGDLLCENSLGEKFLAAAEKLSSLKYPWPLVIRHVL